MSVLSFQCNWCDLQLFILSIFNNHLIKHMRFMWWKVSEPAMNVVKSFFKWTLMSYHIIKHIVIGGMKEPK